MTGTGRDAGRRLVYLPAGGGREPVHLSAGAGLDGGRRAVRAMTGTGRYAGGGR